jgi:NAD(P)-dependent dehydrogenase (short-subunit alcohol dehydrogenase family)
MEITGKTALVTGANRGLGRQLAAQLRDRGARVYAAARDPQAADLAGVSPIALNITGPDSVASAARAASGVAILVNNLHVGYMDTDMTRHLDVPKSDPAAVAKLAIDGIEAGDAEIIADETSKRVLAGLAAGVDGLHPQVA